MGEWWRSPRKEQVVKGRKMRLDTTVVETNIHYPTDSSLLGDGVRVLIRAMKRIGDDRRAEGTKLRDSMRSVQRRVAEIARASRAKGEKGKRESSPCIANCCGTTAARGSQAKRFSGEIASGVKRSPECSSRPPWRV